MSPRTLNGPTEKINRSRDPETGDVILSRKPQDWDGFFDALKGVEVPADFLDQADRGQGIQEAVFGFLKD